MKKLKFYKILFLMFLSLFILSCESEDDINEKTSPDISAVSFAKKTNIASITPENNTYKLEVVTTKAFGSDKTMNIVLDTDNSTGSASDYTLESTSVTIPAGELVGYATFTFDYDNLAIGSLKSLVYDLDVPEELTKNVSLQSTNIKYSRPCQDNLLNFNITWLDKWSSETSWDITDSSNTILFSNSYSNGPDDGMQVSELVCLSSGNYTLNFYDAYGDGLSAGGSFELKLGSTVLASGGGNFGYSVSESFTIQ